MTTLVEIAGYRLPVRITSEENKVSPFTGRELRHVTARASHEDERAHDEIITVTTEGEETRGRLYRGGEGDEGPWEVSVSQWSSSSRDRGGTTFRYTVELTEVEDYAVDTLVVEELELDILAYDERVTGTSLSVNFVGEIAKQDLERYFKLWESHGTYFDVVRKGVDESPRSMRFGMSLWSEHGDTCRVKATLVDASYDDESPGSPFRSMRTPDANARAVLAQRGAMMDQLLEILADKNLLSEQEIEDVQGAAESDDISRQLFRFYCVEDAEEFGPEEG